MLFKDQLGDTIELSQPPQRIISLVPSQTELLIYLGLKDRIVGITKFCVHPKELRAQKTVVGGTKQVNLEKIKALTPDLIIANKEENTQQMVENLKTICPVWVSDVNTLEDNYSLINQLGDLCDVKKKATLLISLTREKQQLFVERIKEVPLASVVYLIWNQPIMGAGSPSFIDALLQLNKFDNLLSSAASRYPEVESLALEKAQHILLSSEPFPFTEKHKQSFGIESNATLSLVDGEYFSWYGSRLLKAFDYFVKLQRNLGRIT